MADQCYQLRNVAQATTDNCNQTQLAEFAYIRSWVYRSRLIFSWAVPSNYHVQYKQVERVDSHTAGSTWRGYRDSQEWTAHRDAFKRYLQDNLDQVKWLMKHIYNLVCLVAYQFHAKGHHYMDTYEESYTNIFAKINSSLHKLNIKFLHLATLAVHTIMPWVHAR